ncbi:hypothetical protein VKT23_000224 [Stygiomarasmius scandens]|uniref:Secreted protein n=1 Tax=Marasmiellus scandens TaxID=2682957 RepID=A0ABR1K606_9AGAR
MRGGLSTFSSAMSVTMMSRLTFHLHQNVEGNRVETYELEVVRFAAATVSTQEQSEDHVPQRLKSPKHSSKRTVVISR